MRKEKRGHKVEKKFYWMAIVSFILGVAAFLILLIGLFIPENLSDTFNSYFNAFPISIFYYSIFLAIIFGVVSLVKLEKKKHLKGKSFAVLGLALSILTTLILIVLALYYIFSYRGPVL